MSAPAGRGLVARDLRRSYRGRLVLANLSLDLRPGEVLGLLGPNGAGKSTAFRILVGLERADRGQVILDGRNLDGLPLWKRVLLGLGYLAQEPSVLQGLDVAGNLRVPLEARGLRGAALEQALGEALEQAGLVALAHSASGTLSGGERRRLELARCLAARPTILLLDEPFAGVDPVAIEGVQQRIRALAAAGIGVLLTDHAVQETLRICDRAIVLDEGRVMAEGQPEQVAADPSVRARYLGPRFSLERE